MKEFVAITDRVNRCSSCFIRAEMGAKCSNIISYSLRKHTYFKTNPTVIFSTEHEQNFNMLTFLTSTGNIFLFVSVKLIFTSSGHAATALLAKGQAAGVIKLIFKRSCSNISQEPVLFTTLLLGYSADLRIVKWLMKLPASCLHSIGCTNFFSNTADQVNNCLQRESCVSSLHTEPYTWRPQNLLHALLFAFHGHFGFFFKHIEIAVVKTTAYKLLIKEATTGIDESKKKSFAFIGRFSPLGPEFKQPTLQLKSSRELKFSMLCWTYYSFSVIAP